MTKPLADLRVGEDGALAFGVLLVVAVVAAFHLVAVGYLVPLGQASSDGSHHDLRGPYFGAVDLRHGHDPYESTVTRRSDIRARRLGIDRMRTLYAPPVLALYLPLTDMPWWRAKVVNLTVSFLCLLGAMAALAWSAPGRRGLAMLVTFPLVAGSTEVFITLALGQVNLAILFLLAVGLGALERGHTRVGGAAIGLATLIKPIPGVVLLGLALRRRWPAVAAGLLAVLLPLWASLVAFGWEVHHSFLRTALRVGSALQADSANQNLAAFFMRALAAGETTDGIVITPLGRILWLSSSALVVALAALSVMRNPRAPLRLTVSLFIAAGLLLSTRTLTHYYVWALIPVAVALFELARRRSWAALLLLGVAYNCMFRASRRWLIGIPLVDGPVFTMSSIPVVGLLIVYGILVHLHKAEPTVGQGAAEPTAAPG
jgi:hypothetical protein